MNAHEAFVLSQHKIRRIRECGTDRSVIIAGRSITVAFAAQFPVNKKADSPCISFCLSDKNDIINTNIPVKSIAFLERLPCSCSYRLVFELGHGSKPTYKCIQGRMY